MQILPKFSRYAGFSGSFQPHVLWFHNTGFFPESINHVIQGLAVTARFGDNKQSKVLFLTLYCKFKEALKCTPRLYYLGLC